MKKGGVFSLITYILYTLFWVAMTLLLHFGILTQEDAGQLGMGLFLVALFEVYTIALVLGSLLLVIIKILHINKGWFFCGIICLLIDIRMVLVFVISVISSFGEMFNALPGVTVILLVPSVLSIGSLISNIRSLRS